MDDHNEAQASLPAFLTDPKGVLQRRWPWITAGAVFALVVGVAVVIVLPQSYVATARLMFSSQRIPEDFVRSTTQESVDEQVNAMIGEVLSRTSLEEVARSHGLAKKDDPDLSEIVGGVRNAIDIEPEQMLSKDQREPSRIFGVMVTMPDPQLAADIANDLVNRFIAAHAERRSRQVRLATEFLRRGMEHADQELREQSAKITEFKEKYRGELPSELQAKLAQLERLQQQRQSLALQISDAESRLLVVQSAAGSLDSREKLLADLRAKLVTEETVNTPEHPNVIALQHQIQELESAPPEKQTGRAAANDPQAEAVAREAAALRQQLAEIEQQMRELDTQVTNIPARQEELEAMVRKEEVLRDAFTEASRKLQEAELAQNLEQAQQGMRLSRLDQAVPPDQPKYPKPLLLLGVFVASLGAGAALGVLLELLDPVILTTRDLEASTGLPLLGVIPHAH